MKPILRLPVFIASSLFLTVSGFTAPVTNADVIKMVSAGLSPDLIVSSIHNNPDKRFDTSPPALAQLQQAKVPNAVITEIITNGGSSSHTAAAAPSSSSDSVILLDNNKEVPLSGLVPDFRVAARAGGFGGSAMYNTLRGARAELRLHNSTPSFIVAVPKGAQVQSYATLASFSVRKDGNREVIIGGGYTSSSVGIHKDRVMPVTIEKLPDQSRAKDGFTVYKLTAAKSLSPGEYALAIAPVSPSTTLSNPTFTCFDFGID